jgi:hypothetical protein
LNKKVLLFSISLALLLTLLLAGCAAEPSTQEIIEKASQAGAEVKSYQYEMEMSFDVEVTSPDEPVAAKLTTSGNGAMDVASRQMKMALNMQMDFPESSKQTIPVSYYMVDGWTYIGMMVPVAGEQWMKTKMDMANVLSQDQLAQQMEFLKTAGTATKVDDQVIDGVECHVLEIVPDMAAIMNWMKSQPTNALQGFNMEGLDLEKMFDNFTVKEWISKADNRIARAEVSLTLKLAPEDMGMEAEGNEQMNMKMHMVMKFHDYDQPVVIILPAEALAAEEITQ